MRRRALTPDSAPGRASWNHRIQTGGPSPAPVQPAPGSPVTRRTVDAQNRPDQGYKPHPGTAPAPSIGCHRSTSLRWAGLGACNCSRDACQVLVTPIVTWSFDRRTPLLQPRPADLAQLSIRSMYRTGPRLSSPAKAGEPVNTMLSGDYWMPRFRGARQWRGCPTALCDSIRADFGLDRTPWARSRCS